jgi:MoxR-like ATPase
MTTIAHYSPDQPVCMPADAHWPASVHRFDADTIAALRLAEVTGRPLLMRGLPGVGKSQSARAAAAAAGRPFLAQVIDGRTEPHDLMWRFDQVKRLADAQVSRHGKKFAAESDYLSPQALWWAFDWNGAAAMANGNSSPTSVPKDWLPDRDRAVLLIDEIDKADPELPNALLEVLSANGFRVPFNGQTVSCPPQRRPLIVITTNEERELPAPFLRRCLVRRLELTDDPKALIAEWTRIATDHQSWLIAQGVRPAEQTCAIVAEVAARVAEERLKRWDPGDYRPGTAEFLDLVNGLAQLWPGDAAAQRSNLKLIDQFALDKSVRGVNSAAA